MSKTTDTNDSICPSCNYEVDTHEGVNHSDKPSPNDLTICFKCGTWNKFGPELQLLALEDAERDSLPADLIAEMEMISSKIKKRNEN